MSGRGIERIDGARCPESVESISMRVSNVRSSRLLLPMLALFAAIIMSVLSIDCNSMLSR